jgi:UDP-N-acetylmuramate dehydrogenase
MHEMYMILRDRSRKFPRKIPNCGSVFLSNPTMYASVGAPGNVIERAGLKGASVGAARVSDLHANFILNCGGATSRDVLQLIAMVREKVFDISGFWLECEVRHVSPLGEVQPAHFVNPLENGID